ncbi:MAG: hypothetical protein NT069_30260, partial [Planctomycetota bacterium]|nr:hypothetical protein [Planctomycetota bacterium]
MASSSKGIRAGRAFVELFGDDAKLQKTLRDASNRLDSWGKSITSVGKSTIMAGAAAIAPLLLATRAFADSGSALNDMAARTGANVESLSSLGFAAQMTGSSLEDLETALKKTSKLITEAREGNKGAAESLAKLGLSADKLKSLKPQDQFREIAKRVAAIKDPAVAAANAMGLWGKSGTSLIPLAKNMGELEARAKSLGIVMSTQDAEAADALGDSIDELIAVAKAATNQIGAALAPALTELATSAAESGAKVIEWIRINRGAIVLAAKLAAGAVVAGIALVALGGAFSIASTAVTTLGMVLSGFVALVGAIGTGVTFLLSPLGLVTAALVGLVYWFASSTTAGQNAVANLVSLFGDLSTQVKMSWGAMSDALARGDVESAAKVLWATLRSIWATGRERVGGVWNQFLSDMLEGTITTADGIANGFLMAVEKIRTAI